MLPEGVAPLEIKTWLSLFRLLPQATVKEIPVPDDRPNTILPLPDQPAGEGKKTEKIPITLANAFFIKINGMLYGIGPGKAGPKIPNLMGGIALVTDHHIAMWAYPPPEDDPELMEWYRQQLELAIDYEQITSKLAPSSKLTVEGLKADGETLTQVTGSYLRVGEELVPLLERGMDSNMVKNCLVIKTGPRFDGLHLAGSPVYVDDPNTKEGKQLVGIVVGQANLEQSGEKALLVTRPGQIHQKINQLFDLQEQYDQSPTLRGTSSI